MAIDVKELISSEWDVLKNSYVVKGIIGMETLAVAAFVNDVIDGKQEISVSALKGWLLFQGAMILAFLFRHAWAGIEVLLAKQLPPELIAKIEAKTQEKALKAIAEKHPEAAETLKTAFSKTEV